MFAGAYWSHRKETRLEAAACLSAFLRRISELSEDFSAWYLDSGERGCLRPHRLCFETVALAAHLQVSQRELGKQHAPLLGYSLGIWSRKRVLLCAILGAHSDCVVNSVVLTDQRTLTVVTEDIWRQVLAQAIGAFQPDQAMVATSEQLVQSGVARPWEVGWLTYRRGGSVLECSRG